MDIRGMSSPQIVCNVFVRIVSVDHLSADSPRTLGNYDHLSVDSPRTLGNIDHLSSDSLRTLGNFDHLSTDCPRTLGNYDHLSVPCPQINKSVIKLNHLSILYIYSLYHYVTSEQGETIYHLYGTGFFNRGKKTSHFQGKATMRQEPKWVYTRGNPGRFSGSSLLQRQIASASISKI